MTLPARAAALRGDDYQHIIGLYHACCLLTDPDLASVSIEDARGGTFDDVVIRMRPDTGRPHEYIQIKSSNYLATAIDEKWLLKAKNTGGKSPLQHFYNTWLRLAAAAEPFMLTLLSNRNYDHNDPVLGLIDNTTNKIPHASVEKISGRGAAAKALQRWTTHLGITRTELAMFLSDVAFVHGESDRSWEDRCRPLMRQAGLRDDDDAMAVGRSMIRQWVTEGRGPQDRDQVRNQITGLNLLARTGTLVLAVHAIEEGPLPDLPNVTINIVDQFPDVDPYQRRQLRDPDAWQRVVLPMLQTSKTDLRAFRSRRVHVLGAMRLPMYFAVGRTLPDVDRWVLSIDQRGVIWSTDAAREPADIQVIHDEITAKTGDLAVAVALAQDPTEEVRTFIDDIPTPIQRLLTLSTAGGHGQTSVPRPGWAADWVSRARERIRAAVRDTGATQVHLFIAAPAALALFLGHQWNMVPTTTVYEHLQPGYAPTFTLAG